MDDRAFSIEEAERFLRTLSQFRQELRQEWSGVSSSWSNLSMTWHDTQRQKFEPAFSKLLARYADVEKECDEYIALLMRKITEASAPNERLADLRDFR